MSLTYASVPPSASCGKGTVWNVRAHTYCVPLFKMHCMAICSSQGTSEQQAHAEIIVQKGAWRCISHALEVATQNAIRCHANDEVSTYCKIVW